ncbi:MAG: MBL fold metallo-hydrolase [Holdemania filiformis]
MEIKHIQDHLMSVEEGYVRCFLIEGENAALVIDGGVEAGLREMVEKQTSKPLTFLLTHSDPDHTAACGEFEEILVHPAEMARLAQKR